MAIVSGDTEVSARRRPPAATPAWVGSAPPDIDLRDPHGDEEPSGRPIDKNETSTAAGRDQEIVEERPTDERPTEAPPVEERVVRLDPPPPPAPKGGVAAPAPPAPAVPMSPPDVTVAPPAPQPPPPPAEVASRAAVTAAGPATSEAAAVSRRTRSLDVIPPPDRTWMIVAAVVIGVAVAANLLTYFRGDRWVSYAVAGLWFIPAVVAWRLARSPFELKLPARRYFGIALGIALTQIGLLLLFGSLYGFDDNLYGSALGLTGRILAALALIIGSEFARYQMVQSLLPDGEDRAIIFPWALLWLASLSVGEVLGAAGGREMFFFFIGVAALPASGTSWFACFLTMRGGPLPPILYRTTLALFILLTPSVPRAPWMYLAVAGYIVPVLAANLVALKPELEGLLRRDALDGPKPRRIGWIAPTFAALATAWVLLTTGVTGYEGIGVSGKSMEPTYHTGDLIITKDVPPSSLEVGDVIVFEQPGREVVHRIIKVRERNGVYRFVTLGDNNNFRDPIVHQDDVRGKVVVHVPYLGWPQVVSEGFFAKFF